MDPRAHPPPHSDTASKSDKRVRESTVLGNCPYESCEMQETMAHEQALNEGVKRKWNAYGDGNVRGGVRSCVLSQLASLTIIGGLPRRVKRQSETVHSMVFLAYSWRSDSRTRRSDCGELVKTYPGKTTGKNEGRLRLSIFRPRLRTAPTNAWNRRLWSSVLS